MTRVKTLLHFERPKAASIISWPLAANFDISGVTDVTPNRNARLLVIDGMLN